MAHMVTCQICRKKFDRDFIQAVRGTSANRYAHYTCNPQGEKVPLAEKPKPEGILNTGSEVVERKREKILYSKDADKSHKRQAIIDYVYEKLNRLKDGAYWARFKKNLNQLEEQEYTLDGIYLTLLFIYDIQGNSAEELKTSFLMMIPYHYYEAKKYFEEISYVQKANLTKNVQNAVNKIQTVKIKIPTDNRKGKMEFKI